MQIFDYAIQMEKDGEKYYRQLAEKSTYKGLIGILTLLADAEVRHQQVLQQMKQKVAVQLSQDTVIKETKNIFRQMLERKQDISVDASHVELYRKAQQLEIQSRDFYLQKAAELTNPEQRRILTSIAEEEQRHHAILQSLIELVSHAEPGGWLENAEWHHLDEY